jgi:hypothetical protein
MATVKTQGGKVILKDGKVSCECCATCVFGCGFYSAPDLLIGNYTASDLPDAVTINWGGNFTGTAIKSGSGYFANNNNITLSVEPIEYIYSGNLAIGLWVLNNVATGARATVGCMLFPYLPTDPFPSNKTYLVQDQFASSYVVTVWKWRTDPLQPQGFDPFPRTVTRTSMCEWTGTGVFDEPIKLYYEFVAQWSYDYIDGFDEPNIYTSAVKLYSAQNTPVGCEIPNNNFYCVS